MRLDCKPPCHVSLCAAGPRPVGGWGLPAGALAVWWLIQGTGAVACCGSLGLCRGIGEHWTRRSYPPGVQAWATGDTCVLSTRWLAVLHLGFCRPLRFCVGFAQDLTNAVYRRRLPAAGSSQEVVPRAVRPGHRCDWPQLSLHHASRQLHVASTPPAGIEASSVIPLCSWHRQLLLGMCAAPTAIPWPPAPAQSHTHKEPSGNCILLPSIFSAAHMLPSKHCVLPRVLLPHRPPPPPLLRCRRCFIITTSWFAPRRPWPASKEWRFLRRAFPASWRASMPTS